MRDGDEIRVLHVDDDPEFAELTAAFLEREDGRFSIDTVESAAEGLDRLTERTYDCVVSDNDMSGMAGIEFLEAVREEYPDLPFILYTGKGSEEIASEAISRGVTDYLQKGTGTSQYAVLANRIRNAVEQYRSQRDLEASQRRLSMFFEQSPLCVVEFDENLHVARINEAAEEVLGYSEEDLVGRSWEYFVPEDEREHVETVVTDLMADEGGYHSVNENVRKDGERIVCAWHNRVVTDDEGDVVAVFSQVQEITESYRRRQRREAQQDALVDLATHDAVTGGEFEAAVRRVTSTAADVLDVDRVSVWLFEDGGETLRCIDQYDRDADRHEAGAELVAENYPAYFGALESSRVIEVADVRADARTRELTDDYFDEEGVGALLDATLRSEGEVIGVVCHEHVGGTREWADDEVHFAGDVADIVHRTVRNRQRAEQQREIEFQRSLLEAQQDAVLDGLLVVDGDGEIVSYNDRFVEMWGLSEAVLDAGDDDAALSTVADRIENRPEFYATREYAQAHPDETTRDEVELQDGRVFDRYSTLLTGPDGTNFGRLWTFRDVTERRTRERRIEALHGATRELMRSKSPEEIAEIAVETARDLLGMPVSCVFLYDEEREALVPAATTADADDLLGDPPVYGPGEGFSWQVFESGETRFFDDVSAESGRYNPETPIRSEIILPLGEHGVVNIGAPTPGSFDVTDVSLAQILAANTEAALTRAEREHRMEQYRTLVETVGDAMYVLDDEGYIEMVNEAMLANLDADRAEVVGSHVRRFVPGEDLKRGTRIAHELVDDDDRRWATYEMTISTPQRGDVPVEANVAPLVDDGTFRGSVGVIRDLTERKRRERERQETIDFLRSLYEVTTDADRTFEDKIARLLELGCERLDVPFGFLTRIDVSDGDDSASGTQTVVESYGPHGELQAGAACPLRETYCRRTIETDDLLAIDDAVEAGLAGDPAYERFDLGSYIGGKVVVDDDLFGTLCFASTAPRDEEFTEADRTLVRLMSKWVGYELERRHATRELERQNRRLEEFASIVSHDLRNPLNVAEGRVDLLREECTSEHLEPIDRAHERMRMLIEDLLVLARVGETATDREPVDLARAVEECWETVDTGEATLVVETDATVRADRSQLQQVLENLVRNAVEHSSTSPRSAAHGDAVEHSSTSPHSDARGDAVEHSSTNPHSDARGDAVEHSSTNPHSDARGDAVEHGSGAPTITVGDLSDGFYVEDDGPGIPPEERDSVFESGYSTAADGTGFGLAIVSGVVEAHDWAVTLAESETGGARFEITGVEFVEPPESATEGE